MGQIKDVQILGVQKASSSDQIEKNIPLKRPAHPYWGIVILSMVLIYFPVWGRVNQLKQRNQKESQGFWGMGGGGLNKYSLDKLSIIICWTHTPIL